MTLDNQTLIFNLDKTFNLFNLSAKQFDTDNARSFTFQFIQNNTPFSLNGINVKVGGVKPDGKKIFNDVQIIDSTNGIVELDLTSQMLAVNGVLKLEFIFMKDNIRLSSYPFEINIVPSITNFNAIISSDEFNTLTNTLNSVDGTINNLTNKVNEAIEKTNVQEIAKEVLGVTLSYINPTFSDCNDFKEPNKYFTWDTGLGAFKNTPLGDLVQNSAIVFEVINYGREGRIQQEFRQTYPPDQSRKWIRNFTSDSNGKWSDWRPEFLGEKEIVVNDDFNNFTSMGCYKVQNVTGANPNSPQHQLDSSIYNFGLLIVFESGVAEEHRVLQVYYPHQEGGVGHRTPVMRMKNSTAWTDWTYIGATPKDIDRLTSQIASNSSSINDLYNWVNKNIQMEYISGATSLTLQPNKAYYLDGQHVADITSIDHSAIPVGGKVYFYVASGDPLAHIVFRRQGLCNQDVRVWLPKGQDFWIVGNTDGDKIFTMMKIGDAMRFLS